VIAALAAGTNEPVTGLVRFWALMIAGPPRPDKAVVAVTAADDFKKLRRLTALGSWFWDIVGLLNTRVNSTANN
jgi:hypothetical protein